MVTKRTIGVCSLVILLLIAGIGRVSAQTPNPTESAFGAGGELEACSTNYCAQQSVGDSTVGKTSSTNYQAQTGSSTTDLPVLEVAVNGNVDFGELDLGTTAAESVNISVRSYLTNGYSFIVAGSPPTYGSHSMDTPNVPTVSQPGTEQFGINLAANTSPAVGDDPVQVPDGSFSFGLVSANYSSPDLFMYNDGDVVAYSASSTGQTDYTLSMIANISRLTPAGKYLTQLSMVVVSVY